MKTLTTLFILFISLYCTSQEFKVMSYNIRCGQCDTDNSNSWFNRKELVLKVIKNDNPDLIGFQEMITEQRDWLLAKMPEYAVYGTGRDADGGGDGCYIFYKRALFSVDSTSSATKWYSSTPNVAGSGDMGDVFKRIITYAHLNVELAGKKFYFFNTHLTYLPKIQPAYISHLTKVIKERVSNDEPFLLTGDFNADENSDALKLLKQYFQSTPLVDSYREIHPTETLSTFNFFTGEKDGKKIDYIFFDASNFKTIEAECINTVVDNKYPSDHYPMTAKFKIKAAQK